MNNIRNAKKEKEKQERQKEYQHFIILIIQKLVELSRKIFCRYFQYSWKIRKFWMNSDFAIISGLIYDRSTVSRIIIHHSDVRIIRFIARSTNGFPSRMRIFSPISSLLLFSIKRATDNQVGRKCAKRKACEKILSVTSQNAICLLFELKLKKKKIYNFEIKFRRYFLKRLNNVKIFNSFIFPMLVPGFPEDLK